MSDMKICFQTARSKELFLVTWA